jgi:hypothetical protein
MIVFRHAYQRDENGREDRYIDGRLMWKWKEPE